MVNKHLNYLKEGTLFILWLAAILAIGLVISLGVPWVIYTVVATPFGLHTLILPVVTFIIIAYILGFAARVA